MSICQCVAVLRHHPRGPRPRSPAPSRCGACPARLQRLRPLAASPPPSTALLPSRAAGQVDRAGGAARRLRRPPPWPRPAERGACGLQINPLRRRPRRREDGPTFFGSVTCRASAAALGRLAIRRGRALGRAPPPRPCARRPRQLARDLGAGRISSAPTRSAAAAAFICRRARGWSSSLRRLASLGGERGLHRAPAPVHTSLGRLRAGAAGPERRPVLLHGVVGSPRGAGRSRPLGATGGGHYNSRSVFRGLGGLRSRTQAHSRRNRDRRLFR